MNMAWVRRPVCIAAAAALLAAGGGAVAFAGTNGSGDSYEGCLSRATGVMYHVKVNPAAAPRCLRHDTVIRWNQTGPQGPQGPAGPAGPAGAVSGMYWENKTYTLSPTANITYKLTCAGAHDDAYSGGYWYDGVNSNQGYGEVFTLQSAPSGDLRGWYLSVENDSVFTLTIHQYTLCGPGNVASLSE